MLFGFITLHFSDKPGSKMSLIGSISSSSIKLSGGPFFTFKPKIKPSYFIQTLDNQIGNKI
jgi:hypothetical protein